MVAVVILEEVVAFRARAVLLLQPRQKRTWRGRQRRRRGNAACERPVC